MPKAAVFIEHRALPGRREEVHRVWEKHLQPQIAANPGHLAYFYCFDGSDPDTIRVFQLYTDEAASMAFLETAAYAEYLADVTPLLSGPPVLGLGELEWAKGED